MIQHPRVITTLFSALSLIGCGSAFAGTAEDPGESARQSIEQKLNLANNATQEWTYSTEADAWVLSVVSAVTNPVLPDQQGVSVCVPGPYVDGIDTDGDGKVDITGAGAEKSVKGALVIDYDTKITSSNGQVYSAATAPVILNTGAAGYGSARNQMASPIFASDGYINVACGNRGKQDSIANSDGSLRYIGDAPSCLADQKAAARFVRYNILLGNLPGNVNYLISTGGSGGGAHAVMFAATSNNPDFYDYQIAAGAVGVYSNGDGSYSTTVTIRGKDYELSDGAWGCVAYSAITSLYEADMAMAFEYTLDSKHAFNTPFQAQLAKYLSQRYMQYINEQNLTVHEAVVGFDLNGDGDTVDIVKLSIEHDLDKYPQTNGYYGTYLDLYHAEYIRNLQWYLNNLSYASDWTWFDAKGKALSDKDVSAMSPEAKAAAFLEGRYAKGASAFAMGGPGGPGGQMGPPPGMEKAGDKMGPPPGMGPGGGKMGPPPGLTAERGGMGGPPSGEGPGRGPGGKGGPMPAGTPGMGSPQGKGSGIDSANYDSYTAMVAAYKADIEEISLGDKYGKNIVNLYNPLNYIGSKKTSGPKWSRIVMGAAEGDMSMFSSLNLHLKWLHAGVDSEIEWQWDGHHVPSEIFGNSLALTVDQMYSRYVDGAVPVDKAPAGQQVKNGSAKEATGKDISSWVEASDMGHISFSLPAAAAYRSAGAMKATPGFDVIDYGQEDYVFGSEKADARHWNRYLLEIFQEHKDVLGPLFKVEK